jgi:NOL1/NOP2/fmu family ribosome biogenesis protein|uniref:rRNA small subunit methyltransferase F RNA-binding PUA-like domain-containing protein n=1 Tax=candidate division WOR-3 bacterium TaxID=2052148 RepID=A0A7C6AB15_UNCW3
MSEQSIEYLKTNFGINPDIFEELAILKIGNEVYIMNKDAISFKQLKTCHRGIKLAQLFSHSIRLSTGAVQLFGKFATKNTIQLNYAEAIMFAQGKEIIPRNKPIPNIDGLVIAQYKQFPIGIGNYKEGKLKSMITRSQVLRFGWRKRKTKYKGALPL